MFICLFEDQAFYLNKKLPKYIHDFFHNITNKSPRRKK